VARWLGGAGGACCGWARRGAAASPAVPSAVRRGPCALEVEAEAAGGSGGAVATVMVRFMGNDADGGGTDRLVVH